TDDPAVLAARRLRKRNLLATLFLSQGVPLLLAGDELGHSQGGNNNAYAQDNAVTWLDWSKPDRELTAFIARLTALRRAHPVLRQRRFLHARKRLADAEPDVVWRKPDGSNPTPQDWHDPAFRALGVELRMAAEGFEPCCDAVMAWFNCGGTVPLTLPAPAEWELVLDSTRPDLTTGPAPAELPAQSVLLFRSAPVEGRAQGEST
ncbi:MAG: glycogen debranching enzyme GlgX, partial [Paracoccaceae bacterium]